MSTHRKSAGAMPWVVWGIPATTIVAIALTIWLALQAPVSNVPEAVARVAQIQSDLGSTVQPVDLQAELRAVDGQLRLRTLAGDWPSSLQLDLRHPTNAAADHVWSLQLQAGQASVSSPNLGQVAWHVHLRDTAGQWQLRARWPAPHAPLRFAPQP